MTPVSTTAPHAVPCCVLCAALRQWLFLLESVPSLIIGLVICVWLPSHPLTAWMLTPHQRELLHMKVRLRHKLKLRYQCTRRNSQIYATKHPEHPPPPPDAPAQQNRYLCCVLPAGPWVGRSSRCRTCQAPLVPAATDLAGHDQQAAPALVLHSRQPHARCVPQSALPLQAPPPPSSPTHTCLTRPTCQTQASAGVW